jgi:acetylornithine deacetylase
MLASSAREAVESWEAVDEAINEGAETAFAFLERLVAAPSTVGHETAAQQVVAAELDRLGFEVTELGIAEEVAAHPRAGVAQAAYKGRPNIRGRINPGRSPSLLLNGHVDVVPADKQTWTSDPRCPGARRVGAPRRQPGGPHPRHPQRAGRA